MTDHAELGGFALLMLKASSETDQPLGLISLSIDLIHARQPAEFKHISKRRKRN